MKKIVFLAFFLIFICFIVEAARTPSILKSASTTKVNREKTETTSKIIIDSNEKTEITKSEDETQERSLALLPNGKAYVGVISFLYLREEPFGEDLARLYNNDEVIIVDRDGDWYEVESEKGSGWVYGKCIFDSPNSNSKGPATDTVELDDEDEDDDEDDENEDVISANSKGIYNYITFNNPGDYKLYFFSNSDSDDDSDDDSKKNTLTSNSESKTSSQKTKTTKTITTKTKTVKKPASKKAKTANKTTKKSSESASKHNNSKDSEISNDSEDHLKAAQIWVDKVYAEVLKNRCLHKGPTAKKFEDIKKKRRISCTTSASIVFQQAGMIPKGKIVSHTKSSIGGKSSDGFDKALKKSVVNAKYLIKGTCDIVMVMKTYNKCPKWLQQKGIYYIQKSNGCVSAGKGRIYSCNQTGKRYTKRSMLYRKSGYCKKKPILFAFVPRTNGKSNVPKDCGFKVKEAWGSGSGSVVGIKTKSGSKSGK